MPIGMNWTPTSSSASCWPSTRALLGSPTTGAWLGASSWYQQTGKTTNAIEQHRELNRLKKTEYPWLYEVSKCAPQEALRDLGRAFTNFFRGLKEGRKVGFPRFRKKGRDDRFRLTGAIRVVGRAVPLPRLGRIRLKEEPQVEGRILSATVNREADRWYVSLTVEVDLPDPEPVRGPAVGVDVGLHCFATVVGDWHGGEDRGAQALGAVSAPPAPLWTPVDVGNCRPQGRCRWLRQEATRKMSWDICLGVAERYHWGGSCS